MISSQRAGGIGWVASMTWTGYLLGRAIPDINRHIHIVVAVVVVLSVIPIGVEWWKARVRGRRDESVPEPAPESVPPRAERRGAE